MRAGKAERQNDLERATRALQKFRSLTPMLTGFVRGLTGNKKIAVQAGAQTASTSKKVTICPPVALGDEYRHPSRRDCSRTGEDGLPLCEGCRSWEAVFVSLLHEMSHVIYTRMESKTYKSAYSYALPLAADILDREMKFAAEDRFASRVDPYLPMVVNALEDVRVDSAMAAERPGVAVMQRASHDSIMRGGLEFAKPNGDIQTIDWAAADPTAQVIVSLISVGLGYGVHESMADEVKAFVEREDVARLCVEVIGSELSIVIIRAAEVIRMGREAGFFPLEDSDDQSGESSDGDEGEEGDGSGQGAGSEGDLSAPEDILAQAAGAVDGSHDSDGSQAREDAGHPDDSKRKPGRGGGREDDTNSEMEIAILQEGWTDAPTIEFGGVEYRPWGREGGSCGKEPGENVLGPSLGKLRAVLAPNQLHEHTRHIRSGRLDSRVLGRRAAVEDNRMFARRVVHTKRDFFFVLGLDVSGSTGAVAGGNRRVIDVLVSAAWAQAELLHRLGVPFAIITHTTGGGWGDDVTLDLREVKGADEPWNSVTKDRLRSIRPMSGNLDARAMVAFRKFAERQQAREKFIIQYSDGEFPVMNIEDEEAVIASEIELYRRRPDLRFMMVGIQTSSPEQFGFDFVRVEDETETMKVVNQIERAVK